MTEKYHKKKVQEFTEAQAKKMPQLEMDALRSQAVVEYAVMMGLLPDPTVEENEDEREI